MLVIEGAPCELNYDTDFAKSDLASINNKFILMRLEAILNAEVDIVCIRIEPYYIRLR